MNKNKDGKKVPKTVNNGMLGTVLATIVITLVFAALIYGMYVFNIVSFFDLSDFLSGNDDQVSPLVNNDTLYDQLNNGSLESEYKMIYKVTPEELTAILSEFDRKSAYSIDAETVNYNSGVSKLTRVQAERKDESFSIRKYIDNELSESIESDGKVVTVTDEIRNRSAVHASNESFDFEAMCSIPSLDDLTEICKDILEGGEDSVIDYDISLVSSGNDSFYRAVFTYPDIMQKEEYYVSPDTQMIVNLYSYLGENLYYRYTLSGYSVLD